MDTNMTVNPTNLRNGNAVSSAFSSAFSTADLYSTSGPNDIEYTYEELDSFLTGNDSLFPDTLPDADMSDADMNGFFAESSPMPMSEMTDSIVQLPQMFQEAQSMMLPQAHAPMPLAPPTDAFVPVTNYGPSYHPLIGWHFPAVSMPATLPPMTMEGYMPMTPDAPHDGLDDMFGSASTMPTLANMPQGDTHHHPTSQTSENVKRQKTRAITHQGKPHSVVRSCVCAERAMKVPRPKNAFILYRLHYSQKLSKAVGGDPSISKTGRQDKMSELAGKRWHAESQSVKDHFHQLAAQEKARHAAQYPNYKYAPIHKQSANFGGPDCTCGAYAANMAAMGGRKVSTHHAVSDSEASDLEQYIPPKSTASRNTHFQAPVAPMMPVAPMPNFGFSTPQQNAEAAAAWRALQAKKAKQQRVANVADQPPKRSTRNAQKSISYAEPDSDEDTIVVASARNTRRPPPINTSAPIKREDEDSSSASSTTSGANSPAAGLRGRHKSSRVAKSRSSVRHLWKKY